MKSTDLDYGNGSGRRFAFVVDGTPADLNPNDAGAMWIPGETFTDATNNISVTVNYDTGTGYNVTIKNAVTSTNQAPNGVISTPSANMTVAAGSIVNFTGTGSDPDNNTPLTYVWFLNNVQMSTAQNWGNYTFSAAGTYTIQYFVIDSKGLADPTAAVRTITVTSASLPAVTFTASPTTITAGGSSLLSWNAVNATSCTASGGWTGAKAVNSSLYVYPTATTTYNLTCTGTGGTAPMKSVTVTVGPNQAPNGVISTPTANMSVVAGTIVNFTGTGTDPDNNIPLSFAWYVNGALVSAAQNLGNYTFSTVGTYTVSLIVKDSKGLADPTAAVRTITVTSAPLPTVTFTASPTTITAGGSSLLSWNATNATSCTATGGWSGAKAVSSSLTVYPAVTTTYNLSCTGTGGTAPTKSVTVTVGSNQAPNGVISAPTANMTVAVGTSVNFTGAGSDPDNNTPLTYVWYLSGSLVSTAQNWGTYKFTVAGTYTIQYIVKDSKGLADPTPDVRTITVTSAVLPSVTFTASPTTITSGAYSLLSWTTTNATTCTASGGWSGTKAVNGSFNFYAYPTVTTTYNLSCTGPGGTAPMKSVTVTVTTASGVDLVIGAVTPNGNFVRGATSYSYATLTNQGTAATTVAMLANLYLSTDSVINSADALIGQASWGYVVAAGTQVNMSFTSNIPTGTFAAGYYYIGAIVDPNNTQVETNNANNTSPPTLVYVY